MEFDDYQNAANGFAVFPGHDDPQELTKSLLYLGLGIGDEAGEVQGKLKKLLRDDDGVVTYERREALKGELGDVLWYVSTLAAHLDLTLSEVAEHNIEKLSSRRDRGVLKGSGDTR